MNSRLIGSIDLKGDALVLSNPLIEVGRLQRSEPDLTKSIQPTGVERSISAMRNSAATTASDWPSRSSWSRRIIRGMAGCGDRAASAEPIVQTVQVKINDRSRIEREEL